jgi:hypothetical protein
MIAYCGLDCGSCPTYLATLADDDQKRRETAAFYRKEFKFDVPEKDINCDGCPSDSGTLFSFCTDCNVRRCCREKGLEHCGLCPDAPCEHLRKMFEFSSDIEKAFSTLPRQ